MRRNENQTFSFMKKLISKLKISLIPESKRDYIRLKDFLTS